MSTGEEVPVRNHYSPSADPPGRVDSLTGIRFVAAFIVFMFHVSLVVFDPFADHGARTVLSAIFGDGGWFGVSMFFVLSGFVLTWTARPDIARGPFWRKRLFKIFPTHAATWALSMLLFAASGTTVLVAVTNLALVHTWVPGHDFYMSVNSPSWSLCSELLFYLLFPFILPVVRRIPRRWLVGTAVALFALTLLVQLAAQLLPADPKAPEGPISVLRYWFVYYLPPVRLPEFVLGMITCRLVRETRLLRINPALAALLMVGAYVLDGFVPFTMSLVTIEFLPIAIFVGSLANADTSRFTRVLRTKTFQWLGNVSFGFYMAQAPVLIFLRLHVMSSQTYGFGEAIGVTVGLFAVTLGVGALLHHGVEMPAMNRWSRARSRELVRQGTEIKELT